MVLKSQSLVNEVRDGDHHLLIEWFVQIPSKDPLNGFLSLTAGKKQFAEVTQVKYGCLLPAS